MLNAAELCVWDAFMYYFDGMEAAAAAADSGAGSVREKEAAPGSEIWRRIFFPSRIEGRSEFIHGK